MDRKDNQTLEEPPEVAPPPYDEIVHEPDSEVCERSEMAAPNQATTLGGMPLPCVIPQTSKSFRGVFFSPFVRAWVPELEAHGIEQSEFLACIDGLNESFVANPALQGLGVVGGVMSMFYGLDPVQWAGTGLQVTAGAASAATSYFRTRAYVKAINETLFHPVGLHLQVLTTKKMTAKVGYTEKKLQLPPLESYDDLERERERGVGAKKAARAVVERFLEQEDSRARRLKALEGYVMPLELDVPNAVAPDNLLRKMGAAQAAKLSRKQEKKLNKDRYKGHRRSLKHERKIDKVRSRGEEKIEELEDDLAHNAAELDNEVAKSDDAKERSKLLAKHGNEHEKLQREINKEVAKMDKKIAERSEKAEKKRAKGDKKESKTANKIRWLVIARWDGADESEADEDEDSVPGLE